MGPSPVVSQRPGTMAHLDAGHTLGWTAAIQRGRKTAACGLSRPLRRPLFMPANLERSSGFCRFHPSDSRNVPSETLPASDKTGCCTPAASRDLGPPTTTLPLWRLAPSKAFQKIQDTGWSARPEPEPAEVCGDGSGGRGGGGSFKCSECWKRSV